MSASGPSVIKKRGRPNRGGGRFNRPRGRGRGRGRPAGPSGGFEGRKAGASAAAEGYLGDAVLYAREDEDFSQQDAPRPRRREPHRVPMQNLHMSVENQDLVRDTLLLLHGNQELELNSEDCYEELDWRAEDQYWTTDTKLVVEETTPNAEPILNEKKQVAAFSRFAVNKLQRFGFDRLLCESALEECDGDIGSALEHLLTLCFAEQLNSLGDSGAAKSDTSWEEVLEQRNEEKMALESIYGDCFTERIPNTIWSLLLELPNLSELVQSSSAAEKAKKTQPREKKQRGHKPLCSYFQRGNCRFGDKCRYRHEVPNEPMPNYVEESVPKIEDKAEDYPYELEIRFPGKHQYPFQVPFIAFSSRNDQLPTHVCLRITERLMNEAVELCQSFSPIIFSLVTLLEDATLIDACYSNRPHPFSLPKPITSRADKAKETKISSVSVMKQGFREVSMNEDGMNEDDDEVEQGEEEEKEEEKEETLKQKYGRKDIMPREIPPEQRRRLDGLIKENFRKKQEVAAYRKMQAKRKSLPAWDKQEEILEALNREQVLVVSGMTGCGKTTQVPQFLLDASLRARRDPVANILCTQPRRISAMAVAERVADERAERLGGVVGYQIRLESVMSPKTRLLFCTTGILLRRLEGDAALNGVSHIIIDEVHERSQDSDFLMMVVKDLLPQRPDLKVILMSATMNAELFSSYFGNCLCIDIPGRTFPVDQYFLEDAVEFTRYQVDERSPFARPLKRANAAPKSSSGTRATVEEITEELDGLSVSHATVLPKDTLQDQNLTPKQLYMRYSDYKRSTVKTMAIMDHEKINNDLIEALLVWIVDGNHEYPRGGAVLVFLPGIAEITSLYDQLFSSARFGGRNRSQFRLIPLHSTLSSEDQHAVFSLPPEGVTKIVLATNIAETSITIEDVVYVIDAGRMKEKRYDASKSMESLELVWVSQANALQRKGRAGRVASGVCFHLFTSHRFEHHLKPQPIPEIQRVPLEQLILCIKILDLFEGLEVEDVLNNLIEPPSSVGVKSALVRLQDLGALDTEKNLTPLGYHLACLPVDVRIGKLMLFGAIFRCLDSALTIAAVLSFRSPFVAPFDKRAEADKTKLDFAVGNSDHLTMLKAYKGWTQAVADGSHAAYLFCQANFLSLKTLQMLASMKHQFTELLSDIGFVREGLTARDIERRIGKWGDGVLAATGPEANTNSDNNKLLAAILVAALYPNVVQVRTPESKYSQTSEGAVARLPKPEELRFSTKSDGYVSIHPSSVNFQVRYYESPYLVFHEKVKTSKIFIRDCTMVSVYPLLLFGGCAIHIDLDRGSFILSVDDGWIRFKASSHQVAELVRELRLELDQLLRDKIESPNMDLCTCPRGSRIISTIVKLITTQ